MIGRIEETRMLKSLLHEEEPQFVAVFGRRRIGKTYLVRESFHHQFTFQHTGISNLAIRNESKKKAQLEKFEESLADAGYRCPEHLCSWNEAFNGLKEVIKNSKEKKKVIFIDELFSLLFLSLYYNYLNLKIVIALGCYWYFPNYVKYLKVIKLGN